MPRPSPRSIALIAAFWFVLQIGGLFSPGLLDDVDSIYIEIAREMLHRHDFVTPYIDGIRFFDKPPLMYWLAAASMCVLGEYDWAARLPLALAVLALLLATYALGLRLFRFLTPQNPDRGALYAALALATSIGPYLYTRFYIPDILIALWMTLSVHFFLLALDRTQPRAPYDHRRPEGSKVIVGLLTTPPQKASSLLPSLAFAATLALNLLTKGLIGLVFPIAFVLLYLTLTRRLRLIPRLHPLPALAVFAVIALPWHVLAAKRNPAIPMPAGIELPAHAGWTWFYLYNEHIARFLGTRVPHDYGQTPRWLFWVYALIWLLPWSIFLPAAIAAARRHLGHREEVTARDREAALTLALWALIVLIFFTVSSRQEYYSIPAFPALALLVGGLLARAETSGHEANRGPEANRAKAWHAWFLLPLSLAIAAVCAFFALTAPHPAPGTDLSSLLSANPELYNLSLGHLFDLTGAAMGLFRAPLTAVAVGFAIIGPASYLLRRTGRHFAANLALAAGMTAVLLAAHEGLVRFNPILGSKGLAQAILADQSYPASPATDQPDLILIDGELTAGSTLLFYTRQPVHLVNGRINGPWFGSFWPDAPAIFESDTTLRQAWASPRRLYLLTCAPAARIRDLARFAPVRTVAQAGGKTILTNR